MQSLRPIVVSNAKNPGSSYGGSMRKFAALCILVILQLAFQLGCQKSSPNLKQTVLCQNGNLRDVGIIGGSVLNEEAWLAKGTVMILTRFANAASEDEVAMCTGTLIDNNIVLTAAHCVNDRVDDSSVFIGFSVDPLCQLTQANRTDLFRQAEKVIQHNYNPGELHPDDVALIRFSGIAPDSFHSLPLQLDRIELAPDQKVYLVGYGRETDVDEADPNYNRLKVAEVYPFRRVDEPIADNANTFDNSSQRLVFDQRRGQGACKGDSGGPALTKNNGELKVIGLTSRGVGLDYPITGSNMTCEQGSEYSSVYYYRSWIKNSYDRLKNSSSRGYLL